MIKPGLITKLIVNMNKRNILHNYSKSITNQVLCTFVLSLALFCMMVNMQQYSEAMAVNCNCLSEIKAL